MLSALLIRSASVFPGTFGAGDGFICNPPQCFLIVIRFLLAALRLQGQLILELDEASLKWGG